MCPVGTAFPSESTVLFAFTPSNAYVKPAKVQISSQIQSPVKAIACIINWWAFMRKFAVKYREMITFIWVDDKAKVDCGKPNLAILLGVRGKKSIVPCTTVLWSLDYDVNSKGLFTLSVCLEVDIHDELDTFFWGQVTILPKDLV